MMWGREPYSVGAQWSVPTKIFAVPAKWNWWMDARSSPVSIGTYRLASFSTSSVTFSTHRSARFWIFRNASGSSTTTVTRSHPLASRRRYRCRREPVLQAASGFSLAGGGHPGEVQASIVPGDRVAHRGSGVHLVVGDAVPVQEPITLADIDVRVAPAGEGDHRFLPVVGVVRRRPGCLDDGDRHADRDHRAGVRRVIEQAGAGATKDTHPRSGQGPHGADHSVYESDSSFRKSSTRPRPWRTGGVRKVRVPFQVRFFSDRAAIGASTLAHSAVVCTDRPSDDRESYWLDPVRFGWDDTQAACH